MLSCRPDVESATPETIQAAASFLEKKLGALRPSVAVVLGSGLSGAVPELKSPLVIPYADIPGFPKTTVRGHSGRLLVGRLPRPGGPLSVAVLQGRFHYYEGHSMGLIGLPVRVLRKLGLEALLITSAVGSLRRDIKPGSLVILKDHLNFIGANPLRGMHQEAFGEMFPDLALAYDPALRRRALALCRRLRLKAREGVYAAVCGPSYETPAEIRAFRKLGGDVVGMSVVPEVIVARQVGVKVLAVSWISNLGAGLAENPLSHPEVLALGEGVARGLRRLIEAMLREWV